MDTLQFENKGLLPGTRVICQLKSKVVRPGTFIDSGNSPIDPLRHGVFIAIESERHVVEWVDLGYIQDIIIAIPPGL